MTEQPANEFSPEAREAANALAEQILALAPPDGGAGVVVAALTRVLATVWAHVAIQRGMSPDSAACMVYRHANGVADAAAQMVAHHYNAVQEQQQRADTDRLRDSLEPEGPLQ